MKPKTLRLWITLRDWWRGYNRQDLESARLKMGNEPGKIVYLNKREYRAFTQGGA